MKSLSSKRSVFLRGEQKQSSLRDELRGKESNLVWKIMLYCNLRFLEVSDYVFTISFDFAQDLGIWRIVSTDFLRWFDYTHHLGSFLGVALSF